MLPPFFAEQGMKDFRIMRDIAATYWMVAVESEELNDFAKEVRGDPLIDPEMIEIMDGYVDLVSGGFRENYLLE